MDKDIRPRNAVLEFVEEDVLTQTQAAEILGVTQSMVYQYIEDYDKYGDVRTEKVMLNRDAIFRLVEDDVLTQPQAASILGISASAVYQALEE